MLKEGWKGQLKLTCCDRSPIPELLVRYRWSCKGRGCGSQKAGDATSRKLSRWGVALQGCGFRGVVAVHRRHSEMAMIVTLVLVYSRFFIPSIIFAKHWKHASQRITTTINQYPICYENAPAPKHFCIRSHHKSFISLRLRYCLPLPPCNLSFYYELLT